MSRPLSERQKAICDRLEYFRKALMISRAKMAERLGIESERLASYEYGRAPVRWEIFLLIARHFNLSPRWLATGESPVRTPYRPIWEHYPIKPKTLFSTAYEQEFTTADRAYDIYAQMTVERYTRPMQLLCKRLDRLENMSKESRDRILADESFSRSISDLIATLGQWETEAEKVIQATAEAAFPAEKPTEHAHVAGGGAFASTWRQLEAQHASESESSRRNPLNNSGLQELNADVPSTFPDIKSLLARVSELTSRRGAKKALAEELKVSPKRISEWLNETYIPDAHNTLRLLQWVQATERKLKVPRTR